MAVTNMEIIRRDDTIINLTFSNSDRTPINITGFTLIFNVKAKTSDPDSRSIIRKVVTVHTLPLQGKTAIAITNTDSNVAEGQYYYDFQLVSAGGSVQSTKRGAFEVIQDISIGTS